MRCEPGRGAARTRAAWVSALRAGRGRARAGEAAEFADDRAPLHPMRLYGELREVLDRNAIVIGDGGDFVSYAGRVMDSYEPGCWLDPGPYGCLGCGPGYALAAKLAHPERQVVLLVGDGAFGFSGMEFDTLARHGVDVVGVMGNNGIWALEKHPMEMLYGYSVVADLRPGTRYEKVVRRSAATARSSNGPRDLRPALVRAFEAGRPALVNVLADPAVAYPRRSTSPERPRVCIDMEAAREGRLPKAAPTGRAGVRAMKGPGSTVRTAGGADSMRLRPNLCSRRRDRHAFRHDHPFASEVGRLPLRSEAAIEHSSRRVNRSGDAT